LGAVRAARTRLEIREIGAVVALLQEPTGQTLGHVVFDHALESIAEQERHVAFDHKAQVLRIVGEAERTQEAQ